MKKIFILLVLFIISVAVAVGIVVNERSKDRSGAFTRSSTATLGTSSVSFTPSPAPSSSSAPPATYTAPALPLTILAPKNNATVNTASVTVTGKTNPGASVIINDIEMKADAAGNFSRTLALDEGENYVSIVAYTESGDVSETQLLVVRE